MILLGKHAVFLHAQQITNALDKGLAALVPEGFVVSRQEGQHREAGDGDVEGSAPGAVFGLVLHEVIAALSGPLSFSLSLPFSWLLDAPAKRKNDPTSSPITIKR